MWRCPWAAPVSSTDSTRVLEARPGSMPGGGGGVSPRASLVSPALLVMYLKQPGVAPSSVARPSLNWYKS